MGSSTSKSFDPETAVPPPLPASGHRRSYSRNMFQSSCIQPASGSPDSSDIDDDVCEDIDDHQVSDHQAKENGVEGNVPSESTSKSKGKSERKKKVKRTDKTPNVPSQTHFGEWGESSLTATVSINDSGPSSRFLSRFGFFNGKTHESSASSIVSNDEELHSRRFDDRSKTSQGCELFPCFMPRSSEPQDEDSNSEYRGVSNIDNRVESNGDMYSRRDVSGYEERRNEAREPVEQSVRFSRTLSVGRLRDRVIHRSAFPEMESHVSNENALVSTTSSSYTPLIVSSSLFETDDLQVQNIRGRGARYSDLIEHRSSFLERRRRIRSQVRALQRMGSQFENLSSHDRSCILTGQHRTGHCACHLNNQDQNDGTHARASISRIVLLAEALFEVLDEIHQQSVVLSSRPSLSSLGSVPAPNEVVETLPVKLYCKLPKHVHEEDAQCYICLVEYEDGDEVRVLPCRHEFHKLCVDKWLKDVHRICPLCRGDVCKSDSLPTAAPTNLGA